MTSRAFLALAPAALISLALAMGASCGDSNPQHDLDGGLIGTGGAGGAGASISSSSSSSSSSTTSSSSSSSSSTGGSALCTDGKKNGNETDIDCGGGTCPACVDNKSCQANTDCTSMVCTNMKCTPPSCADGIQNGNETDKDCGGLLCTKCDANQKCLQDSDCKDKVCDLTVTPHTCKPHTCTDGIQNGAETDIDCGGSDCPPCNPGQKCIAADDCTGQNCQNGICACPTGMLVVPIQGGGIYCVDANEVSYGQYQIFYNANPPTGSQQSYCLWNTSYTPAGDWPPLPAQVADPVRFVNWCQADAFCRYEGRRLCGAIGGGHAQMSDFANFHKDQWHNACTAQGMNTSYPYGGAYDGTKCNGASPGGAPISPQMLMNCIGGEPGLFEMSGNVAEWEDTCTGYAGQSESCGVRGGSYQSDATALRCDSGGTLATKTRDYQGRDVGFRCCL
jgi:hypothetical protein